MCVCGLRIDLWKVLRSELISPGERRRPARRLCNGFHKPPFGWNESGFFPNIQGGSRRVPGSHASTQEGNICIIHCGGTGVSTPGDEEKMLRNVKIGGPWRQIPRSCCFSKHPSFELQQKQNFFRQHKVFFIISHFGKCC